jgi:hypothetical protein
VAITVQDIRTQLPEFAALDGEQIELALAKAGRRINTTQWGSKADDAMVCLTGHLLALSCKQGEGPVGPVTSEKVGDVSVTYLVPESFKRSALASTQYGRCYLELLATIFPYRCV